MKRWFSVFNFTNYPAVSYGFAVNEEGVCVTANEKVSWMVGRKLEFITKFFEDKKVDLIEIRVNDNTALDTCKEMV